MDLLTRLVTAFWVLTAAGWTFGQAARLEASDLLLLVNSNVAESRALAEHYARVRQVPDGRIVALDLPTGEVISSREFHEKVRPAIRDAVARDGLGGKVRCVVSFHGVPLRIERRTPDEAEQIELAEIDRRLRRSASELLPFATRLETLAGSLEASFRPATPETHAAALLQRMQRATGVIEQQLGKLDATDPRVEAARRQLGQVAQALRMAPLDAAGQIRLAELSGQSDTPAGRVALRHFAEERLGPVGLVNVLLRQRQTLESEQSGASFESELALLNWPDYPLSRWVDNPLYWRARAGVVNAPTLLTARLDAETPQMVRRMIDDAIKTERDGLIGKIVIDSRGIPLFQPDGTVDGYGIYDEGLRRLARLLEQHGRLPLVHDSAPEIILPDAIDGIAVYVGWYSVSNYVRPGRFERGAVGFHVASFEMTSLRDPRNRGWVRGLLRDGVVGTLGPVAEPYLHSFPPADEFYPLLLSGRLTLAEVYWLTTPLASWKVGLVGDPLYRPFAAKPALDWQHVPEPLRLAVEQRIDLGR